MTEDNKPTCPSPAEASAQPPAPPAPWQERGVLATSWPIQTASGHRQFVRFANQVAAPLLAQDGNVLDVIGYILEEREKIDEATGEISVFKYVKLCCADGSCHETPGVTARRCVGRIAWGAAPSPWDPPMRLLVKVHKLPNAHSVYSIVPVNDEESAPKSGAKRK